MLINHKINQSNCISTNWIINLDALIAKQEKANYNYMKKKIWWYCKLCLSYKNVSKNKYSVNIWIMEVQFCYIYQFHGFQDRKFWFGFSIFGRKSSHFSLIVRVTFFDENEKITFLSFVALSYSDFFNSALCVVLCLPLICSNKSRRLLSVLLHFSSSIYPLGVEFSKSSYLIMHCNITAISFFFPTQYVHNILNICLLKHIYMFLFLICVHSLPYRRISNCIQALLVPVLFTDYLKILSMQIKLSYNFKFIVLYFLECLCIIYEKV